jgi:hypothetical protein
VHGVHERRRDDEDAAWPHQPVELWQTLPKVGHVLKDLRASSTGTTRVAVCWCRGASARPRERCGHEAVRAAVARSRRRGGTEASRWAS